MLLRKPSKTVELYTPFPKRLIGKLLYFKHFSLPTTTISLRQLDSNSTTLTRCSLVDRPNKHCHGIQRNIKMIRSIWPTPLNVTDL